MGSEMCIRDRTHTSDDSYIYQLSLVLATATVSLRIVQGVVLYEERDVMLRYLT